MIGDGIRRNIATVSRQERDLFIDAIKKLNGPPFVYPGLRSDFSAGGVTYWFKQDEVHHASHVHGCPQFPPWHRELCNRFEALLRQVHPRAVPPLLGLERRSLEPDRRRREPPQPVRS
jgi:hypothetical protein